MDLDNWPWTEEEKKELEELEKYLSKPRTKAPSAVFVPGPSNSKRRRLTIDDLRRLEGLPDDMAFIILREED